MKKCKHCKGTGWITYKNFQSLCYYCRGKGVKYNPYGRDNTNGKTMIKPAEEVEDGDR